MFNRSEIEIEKVALIFINLGAHKSQAKVMAHQLLKRVDQIAKVRGLSKVDALETLLKRVVEARKGD